MTGTRTDTRDRVLAYIVSYKQAHDGVAPTYDEIATACYIVKSVVEYHINNLVRDGCIKVIGPRGIMVVGGQWRMQA